MIDAFERRDAQSAALALGAEVDVSFNLAMSTAWHQREYLFEATGSRALSLSFANERPGFAAVAAASIHGPGGIGANRPL